MAYKIFQKTAIGFLFIGTVLSTAYMGLFVYLVSVWPINDDSLSSMKNVDWMHQAIINTIIGCVAGFSLGGFIFLIHHLIFKYLLRIKNSRVPMLLSTLSSLVIIIISIVGGIQFWIEKPYM